MTLVKIVLDQPYFYLFPLLPIPTPPSPLASPARIFSFLFSLLGQGTYKVEPTACSRGGQLVGPHSDPSEPQPIEPPNT